MTTELQSRIVSRLQKRKHTLSEIASEIGEPKEAIKPAILVMESEGLVCQEDDYYCIQAEQPNSAPVQNSAAEVEDQEAVNAENAAKGEEDSPKREELVKSFRAAIQAADKADASVLAAEKKSCVKLHCLGKVAIELKATFKHGEWGPFLEAEKADQNYINRAMRLAKFLTGAQCQDMPILEAEILIKKIRKSGQATEDDITAARKEYETYRREQLQRVAREALVDLVDPQVGYYRLKNVGDLPDLFVHVTDVRDDGVYVTLPEEAAKGEEGRYPETIAKFCNDVICEVSKEEFDAAVESVLESDKEETQEKPATGLGPVETRRKEPEEGELVPVEPRPKGSGSRPGLVVHSPEADGEEGTPTDSATAEKEEADSEEPPADYIVRGDYRWSIPKGESQEYDCWDRDDDVIGSIKCLHGTWFAVIELGKFESQEEAMSAVEEAWAKLGG